MKLDAYIEDVTKEINDTLQQLVSSAHNPYIQLFEAAKYSLFTGGKRLRPLLAVSVSEIFGISHQTSLQPACSLELVHTYSLIHDDLPCMDNDDYRRGKPTLHKVYNEGHAVLTGDFLLSLAFENIANASLLGAEQRIALISSLGKHAGAHGMLGGQVLDLASTGKQIDLATLQEIHLKKTGAIIIACFEFGGIIGKANEHELSLLRIIGKNLGLAFQIIDDVLDMTLEADKNGKKRHSDQANNKITYATLMTLEEAKKEASHLLDQSLDLLNTLPYNTEKLQELAQLLVNRQL